MRADMGCDGGEVAYVQLMRAFDGFIDPALLVPGWDAEGAPFLVVDLDRAGPVATPPTLPPCPVIGVGDGDHPLASCCDLLVEPPIALEPLLQSIKDNWGAAAVVVQLLRAIEGQAVETALVLESLAYGLLQGGGEHAAWLAGRRPVEPAPPGEVQIARNGDSIDIVLDRPDAHNAVDRPMRDGLREAFELAALDPDVEEVHLRGAGKAFSVGADLAEFGTTRDPLVAHAIRMRTLPAHAIVRCTEKLTAHVQGACVGAGLEMAAFAKRVIAHEDAWFQLPELAMGLLPGAGGCVSVSRRIGRQRAALLILSGRRINARTALSWGLVDDLAADESEAHVVR